MVDTGVGNDDDTGLLERAGDVVGERTGGESASNGGGTGLSSELEDGTVTILTTRNDTDVGGVLDGSKNTGGKDDLLPGLANVDNIDSIRASLPQVGFHVNLQVLGSEVALSCKEHLNVLGGRIEDRRKVGWGHLCDLT